MDWIIDNDQYISGGFADVLTQASKTVHDNVDAIYNGIDAMNEGWSGTEYDDFKLKAYNYKPYLDALEVIYEVYKTMLTNQILGEFSKTLVKDVRDAIDLLGDE